MSPRASKKTGPKATCRPRIRVMREGEIALGPGKVDLLEAIDTAGSISGAGRALGLSYRRAWDLVATMNACFEEPLVAPVTGGRGGGGARLTPLGRRVLKLYRAMEHQARKAFQADWLKLRKHLKP